ncbi:expressed unknown protein [Seminavis robusta]|uniref:Uncharacterized protein n=1 Tax=Seminavis robusta TaxID=568900 RepID=A0A9N8H380_9STRA|nr:expressed unknown protein [Seminavis robusta]|eukprot:Sro21_g014770.1 n/a (314) ;mRNA; f:94045-94986
MDPRRNSFLNLIVSVETGKDIELEQLGADLDGSGNNQQQQEEGDDNAHHHHKKEKKKKKKDKYAAEGIEPIAEEPDAAADQEEGEVKVKKKKKKHKQAAEDAIIEEQDAAEEEEGAKKKKKKDKKKKDKKKKKKKEEGGDDDAESDLELDSDDDLSLGSVPMSSSSEDDDDDDQDEMATSLPTQKDLSKGVSNRALVADGRFQKVPGFQRSNTNPNAGQHINSKRRNTLGAALKGFQIDVKSLQQAADDQDHSDSGLDQMTGLKSNLPALSVSGVKASKPSAARRQTTAFDSFLKDSSLSENNVFEDESQKDH